MKIIIKAVLIIQLCLISYNSAAQKSIQYLQPGRLYSKGIVYAEEPMILKSVKRLTLVNDTILNYTDPETGMQVSLNVSDLPVSYVKVRTGTRARDFGSIGAGIGFVYSMTETFQNGSQSSPIMDILMITLGGLVAGELIGVMLPKYKNLYFPDSFKGNRVEFSLVSYRGGETGVGLYITF